MTIKKKIVIWYTIWMTVLVIVAALILFSLSGVMVERSSIRNLEEVVHDAAEDVWVRDGRVRTDDLDYFDDGVYISIWNGEELIEGRFPEDAPVTLYDENRLQSIAGEYGSWYVLDIPIGDGFFLRGAARAYDMGSLFSSMQFVIIILLPFMVVLAAFGGYLIVRRSFAPADKVIATAGDIADSNDLSKRIGLGEGSDEIHQMASAFDSMLERLEAAFEKEKQFTSDASHELRTPISVILAEADYAQNHTSEPEKMDEAIAVISRQGEKMSRLVSELLTLARSDKGTLKINKESFNLAELGEMVLSTMEDKAAEKSISLTLKSSDDITVNADQGMLARLMINLVSNAISYGKNGGFVILRISRHEGNAVIAVEDNGKGISSEHLGRIWDRFYQVDPSRTMDSSSGAGLGLSIVKEIAEAHGGKCSVESYEGQGSIFSVELPIIE